MAIGCISVDDYDWPVTMAIEPLVHAGRMAVERMLDIVQGKTVKPEIAVPYSDDLLIRQSCGCIIAQQKMPVSVSCQSEKQNESNLPTPAEYSPACMHAYNVLAGFGTATPSACGIIASLESTMRAAIQGKDQGEFFDALRCLVHECGAKRNGAFALASIVNILYEAGTRHEGTPVDEKAGQSLLLRAQAHILEELFYAHDMQDYLDYSELNRTFHTNLLFIASATRISDICVPLARFAAAIGLKAMHVCIYEGMGVPTEYSRQILLYESNRAECAKEDSTHFSTRLLCPGGIRNQDGENFHVVLPLFTNENMGFMTCSFALQSIQYYRTIREQLSSTLTTAYLFQRLERHAESIDNINHKLKGETAHRLQLQQQLIQTQKMEAIGRVAGSLAHDFNNLLTIIIGNCSYIIARYPDHEHIHERLGAAINASEMASNLTKQLLAFSRKQFLELKVHNLNDIIKNISALLASSLGPDIRLSIDLCNNKALIKADKSQIEQIMMNLAVNARDAMNSRGLLEIKTSLCPAGEVPVAPAQALQADVFVRMTVADTGCGMDEETQQKIFEPFFTTKSSDKGSGMGLSIAYGIVKQCNGIIQVKSAPGKGAQFDIFFPCEKLPDETPMSVDGPAQKQHTVLLVDDEETIRLLAGAALRDSGYAVLEACDGCEAETIVRGHNGPVHLIISDVVMPRMQGPELVGKVRELHPDVKTLYISGYARGFNLTSKNSAFLVKPFDLEVFINKVSEMLSESSSFTAR